MDGSGSSSSTVDIVSTEDDEAVPHELSGGGDDVSEWPGDAGVSFGGCCASEVLASEVVTASTSLGGWAVRLFGEMYGMAEGVR